MDWPELAPNSYLDMSRGPGDIRVRGTRVHLELVIEAYEEGSDPEMIVALYPSLTLEAVHGVIAYYLGHREAIARYVALNAEAAREREAEYDANPRSPVVERVLAWKAAQKKKTA